MKADQGSIQFDEPDCVNPFEAYFNEGSMFGNMDLREKVENGISFCNVQYGPDWINRIDLDLLSMSNHRNCIIGQLDPHCDNIFLDVNRDLGFYDEDCKTLTSIWKERILQLREQNDARN